MGKNWAMVIGINRYDYLQDLEYAQRDAQAMRDYFRDEVKFEQVYYFAADAADIPGTTGSFRTQPTFTALMRFLKERFNQPFLRSGDNFWFFFAGHGIRHENRDYLMPTDGDSGDVERTAIPMNYVTERLRQCGADNVVLLVDACRTQGRRDGVGVGAEKQQGVITIVSCSPYEYSYEILELQQGAFTYALLEGLRIQGEGNCATVERLCHHLRQRVPQLTQQYRRSLQTPCETVEPGSKYHLVLLPRYATVRDAETLKKDALMAEANWDWVLAKQLWLRVLAVSPADGEAVEAIERLARQRGSSSGRRNSTQQRSQSSARGGGSVATGEIWQRRQVLQWLGWGSVGLIATVLGSLVFPMSGEEETPPVSPTPSSTPEQVVNNPDTAKEGKPADKPSSVALKTVSFEVVTVDATGKQINSQRREARQFTEGLAENVGLEMVAIPGGEFLMGTEEAEIERLSKEYDADYFKAESPQHQVSVSPFFLGKYSVTQAQWQAVAALPKVERDLKPDPSTFKGANRPVERVSWYEAMEFCARLSRKMGKDYRLPSEAEWEYACRAGTKTPFHFGETITSDLANYNGNYTYAQAPKGVFREQTTEVGSFPANAFGLCDMHGNVWEWCADDWHENYQGAPSNGSIWSSSDKNNKTKVLRGGSWNNLARVCRSADRVKGGSVGRISGNYYSGFRVACSASRDS